ncbi:MAG TPA: kelch repeat-containing protein [Acidimicrobiia bacterium]|nr:kelch repeat-containing protein [Acidimicrobiia bacterium]
MTERFEDTLGARLATLAREAVPESEAAALDELPMARVVAMPSRRRLSTRPLLAAAAIITVIAVGGALLATRHDNGTDVQGPKATWSTVPRSPLSPRYEHSTVFTGKEVLIWGGRDDPYTGTATAASPSQAANNLLDDGAAYNVTTHTWRMLPKSPLSARFGAIAEWTGKEMLIVGGTATGPAAADFRRDGAAYNPKTNTWRRLPDAPGCPRFGAWTGTELVVGGGCNGVPPASMSAALLPNTNYWKPLSVPPIPVNAFVTANGAVAGFEYQTERVVRLHDPIAPTTPTKDRWETLPPLPIDRTASDFLAVTSLLTSGPDGSVTIVRTLANPKHGRNTQLWRYDDQQHRWLNVGAFAIEGPSSVLDGSVPVASTGSLLMWQAFSADYSWFDTATGAKATTTKAPILLSFEGGSLVAIGDGQFFIWGGKYKGLVGDPRGNQPSAEGAILTIQ